MTRHLLGLAVLAAGIALGFIAAASADPLGKLTVEEFKAALESRFAVRIRPNSPFAIARARSIAPSWESDTKVLEVARARGIYGADTRADWFGIRDNGVRRLARASAALVDVSLLVPEDPVKLKGTQTLRKRRDLCPTERFAGQTQLGFCSGTLVAPDLVLTAGHCVREITPEKAPLELQSVRFVFGYRVEAEGSDNAAPISADNVFAGKEVAGGDFTEDKQDWALVRLDRSVPANVAEPVSDWSPAAPKTNQAVFMIGYPDGLPLKYAPGAKVFDAEPKEYFVANLNSFHANSGSGIYDAFSLQLVGVLVRGETDYIWDESANCARANVCPKICNGQGCQLHCSGEHVSRIALVKKPEG
jgi:V8-like Glu-specific endopeptidase